MVTAPTYYFYSMKLLYIDGIEIFHPTAICSKFSLSFIFNFIYARLCRYNNYFDGRTLNILKVYIFNALLNFTGL